MTRAVVGVFSGEAVGVLVHVERADQYRASSFHLADQKGICCGRWMTAIDD